MPNFRVSPTSNPSSDAIKLSFNGTSSYVFKNTETAYNLGAFTICFKVRGLGTANNDKRVFAEGSSTTTNPVYDLGTQDSVSNLSTGPKLTFFVRNNVGGVLVQHVVSSIDVFDDMEHQIVWVDNNGIVQLYVDGVLDTANFNYTRGTITLNRTAVGALLRATPGTFFKGTIDDVRVFSLAFSSTQATNYLNGILPTSPILEWLFNEGTGLVAQDTSPSQTNGTIVAPLWSFASPSPNTRITNFSNNVRVDNATVSTEIITVSGGGGSGQFAGKGYLIGMMALTYIAPQGSGGSSTILITNLGQRPNTRINNFNTIIRNSSSLTPNIRITTNG